MAKYLTPGIQIAWLSCLDTQINTKPSQVATCLCLDPLRSVLFGSAQLFSPEGGADPLDKEKGNPLPLEIKLDIPNSNCDNV